MAKTKPNFLDQVRGRQPAAPTGDSVTAHNERPNVVAKALEEAGEGANDTKKPAPVQRNRVGMKKATVHMNDDARTELKIFAMKQGEGLEEFILKAINERLDRMKAEFTIS